MIEKYTPYQANRVTTLGHVLGVRDAVSSLDDETIILVKRTEEDKGQVLVTFDREQLMTGLRKVTFSLSGDLKAEGLKELAQEIVKKHLEDKKK